MDIISIKEFHDAFKGGRPTDAPIGKIFELTCSQIIKRPNINFCLCYGGDDKMDFLRSIAKKDENVHLCLYNTDSLQVINGEALYVPEPSIRAKCIALLSDDEALEFISSKEKA